LFLVHPIHPEATVGVSNGFDNVPVALFYLLALHGYARARRTGRARRHVAGALWTFLAFAFKESGLGIPFSVVAMEQCLGGAWGGPFRRRAAHLAPYLALFGAYMAFRVHLFGDIGGYKGPTGGSRYFNVDFAMLLWRDLTAIPYMLLVPVNAKAAQGAYDALARGLAIAALLAAALSAFRRRARGRAELFGLLLAATACIPSVSLLQLSTNLQESRHFHIPAAGLGLTLASLLIAPGVGRARAGLAAARGAVVVAALLVLHGLNIRPWNEVAEISEAIPEQVSRYISVLNRDANLVLYGLDTNHDGVIVGLGPTFKEAIRLRYALFDFFRFHLLVDSRKDQFGQEALDPRALRWGTRDYAFEWDPERREVVSRTFALRTILRDRE
ncbi:MAG: hypothetical protein K8I02_06025, partial [Candidatus Methylomirabilis sp.]|nr:hypothetical protein [Deltaproteobacteria bacterium]